MSWFERAGNLRDYVLPPCLRAEKDDAMLLDTFQLPLAHVTAGEAGTNRMLDSRTVSRPELS